MGKVIQHLKERKKKNNNLYSIDNAIGMVLLVKLDKGLSKIRRFRTGGRFYTT